MCFARFQDGVHKYKMSLNFEVTDDDGFTSNDYVHWARRGRKEM